MRSLATILSVGLAVGGCGNSNSVTASNGAAACATASSCGLLGQGGIQSCTTGVLAINDPAVVAVFRVPLTGAEVNCLAQAGKDCTAAKRCLDNGMTPSSCTGQGPQSCSGNLLQSCASDSSGNTFTTQFDCSFYGEMCLQGKQTVQCGTGTCSVAGSTSCMANLLNTCDGNNLYHTTDCSIIGATCIPGMLASHCRGTGAACQGPTLGLGDATIRCDGDKLVSCADGQEAEFDCTKVMNHCFVNAKGQHAACALGADCDPGNYQTVCMGTKLTFCNNGKVDTFDCASGGWSTCKPDNGGSCS
jgi:hypothetical protein